MWSTVALNISPPSSRCAAFVRARFFRSLFISGPSEPPRLITIAYMPSDPSAPFQLAARMRGKPGEQRQKEKKKHTRCRDPNYATSPRIFFYVALQSAKVSSCAEPPSARPSRGGKLRRSCQELQVDVVTDRQESAGGEGSRDHNGVPQATSRMRADFAAVRFGICEPRLFPAVVR